MGAFELDGSMVKGRTMLNLVSSTVWGAGAKDRGNAPNPALVAGRTVIRTFFWCLFCEKCGSEKKVVHAMWAVPARTDL